MFRMICCGRVAHTQTLETYSSYLVNISKKGGSTTRDSKCAWRSCASYRIPYESSLSAASSSTLGRTPIAMLANVLSSSASTAGDVRTGDGYGDWGLDWTGLPLPRFFLGPVSE
jgi:hypothetical protein